MAPPPVETLDDAGKVRRAEQFIERHNYAEAAQIAEELASREATNADYQALRALVLYHQFVGSKPTRALIEAIESTLRLNVEHPRGLYLKGLVRGGSQTRRRPARVAPREDASRSVTRQQISKRPAAPMPPPMHIVTTAYLALRRLPSISACPVMREPLMP
jgi:hypothetical protein